MEFQTLIENRRSVRKYSSHTNVTKEQIQQLVQAALEAPSWKNTETGRYYCVLSADMSHANNDVKTEHAALIVTTFVHNRAGFQTDGTPDNEIGNGWGCYDLGLQNENLILKATELGLSTLIMGLRDGDKIREMLSIPESETIVSVIAVGKADEEPSRPRRRELEDVLKFF